MAPTRAPQCPAASLRQAEQAERQPKGEEGKRYRAVVSRVGTEPHLRIDEIGSEVPFAYRCVKKRPGEPRVLLEVGDEVECKLARSDPVKAISVKIVNRSGHQQLPSGSPHSQRENTGSDISTPRRPSAPAPAEVVTLSPEARLMDTISADQIDALIDDCLGEVLPSERKCTIEATTLDALVNTLSQEQPALPEKRPKSAEVSYFSHDPYSTPDVPSSRTVAVIDGIEYDRADFCEAARYFFDGPVFLGRAPEM
eukprot:TRINITY_DN70335_c0_g1_i1.p2 TRINITY_DN70335_c0_g1~~TRINITY_DN70335_c0_g1_i1.p2  ORF type:complete len:285 (+),score=84.29 TRINITY_DN70335_c0_g1_i1:95-856(+)